MNLTNEEVKSLILTTALLAVAFMIILAVAELMRESRRIEAKVVEADVAAAQVWQVLREARDITREAARKRVIRGEVTGDGVG